MSSRSIRSKADGFQRPLILGVYAPTWVRPRAPRGVPSPGPRPGAPRARRLSPVRKSAEHEPGS
jgi:hypothetical protein